MTLGIPGAESNRLRVGVVFLVIGFLLLGWASGNWIYRADQLGGEAVMIAPEGTAAADPAALGSALGLVLLFGFIVALVVLIGSYVIIRGARRRQSVLQRGHAGSTASDDVWSTHRVPEFDDEDEDERGNEIDGR